MTTPQLTAPQLACLRVLWDRGEATAAEIHRAVATRGKPAYTTVATVLGRLEQRGLVAHREDGRAHVYRATLGEEQALDGLASELTERAFDGNASELLAALVRARDLGTGDLKRMRALIDAAEQRQRTGGSE